MKQRIAVIFGGKSVEHEISILSAVQVMAAMDRGRFEVIPIYITRTGQWLTGRNFDQLATFKALGRVERRGHAVTINFNNHQAELATIGWLGAKTLSVDIIFPVLHGTNGEDGTIQGLLELLNLPYVGCGITASALAMDKILTKQILLAQKIPTPDFLWFYTERWQMVPMQVMELIHTKFKFPLVVKPAILGSSIGVSVVKDDAELEDAIDLAASLSEKILVERKITPLREINCAVLGVGEDTIVSECEEPLRSEEFLSYRDKYVGGSKDKRGEIRIPTKTSENAGMSGAKRRLPALLSEELKTKIQRTAQQVFRELDCSGVVRIDFLLNSDTQEFYVCEANTIPGSLAFYLWEATGVNFSELIDRLLRLAEQKFRQRQRLTTQYSNNIFGN